MAEYISDSEIEIELSPNGIVDYDSSDENLVEEKEKNKEAKEENKEESKETDKKSKTKTMPKITNIATVKNVNLSGVVKEEKRKYELEDTTLDKLNNSLSMVERVMEQANKMMLSMAEVSKNNLEAERLRLKRVELEAEKKSDTKDEIRVQRTQTQQSQAAENRCHRCNGVGHWAKNCHLQNSGQWFCYYCQAIRNHKGDECRNAKNKQDKRKH